jgi:PAS domain S-box-containing protein
MRSIAFPRHVWDSEPEDTEAMDDQPGKASPGRIAAVAALVMAGCYVGASAGTWLRFPVVGAALLFPPYAVVTAALMRTHPRHWWLVLLAASAGDYLPHRLDGASLEFVIGAEVVNHARALIAAIGVRRFGGGSGRLATLREMIAYLVFAVFFGPMVAALGGAWLVTAHGATGAFWVVWQEWWLSNAITGLTLLVLLTIDPRRLADGWRVRGRRAAEAFGFAAALIAVSMLVFGRPFDPTTPHPSHLYWAPPFLLWSAVRFGPRATSAAVLGVAMLSIWAAINGRGPFSLGSPNENLLELQLFLLVASIPTLLLATLIEQQHRTATALADSQREYRSVVEDQTEMICRFRPDGTYTFANRAYREAFGLVPDGVLGRNIWRLVPSDIHPAGAELAAMTPAAPIATREVSVGTHAGSVHWQQWRDRALFDERGALVEYQAVGRDITDRRRAEDKRRELEAQKSVEAALREGHRRKDEFLGMLGHELRNPLAPIAIALEILRKAPPGSDDAAWALESIGRQLSHMTRLLDDLLDISRVTRGKIQLQIDRAEMGRVVGNAVEAARPLIDSCGHALTVKLPAAPIMVRVDAVRLTQVVANLLNNAAKYTERGGRIDVSLERDDSGIRLSVRDNGVGIAADALDRIFELFSQLPRGGERVPEGLGIGLTLARRLVELHGGSVEARSEGIDRGTEMVVRLPAELIDVVAPLPPPAPARAPESAPKSLRILAVDDNIQMAQGLASVLGMWGHTVRTAHDGAAALTLANSFAPEVVLLDLSLPVVDGLEVARRLRATPERSPALLVSMSGFAQEETRRHSGEAGFHHHLVKPFDMGSLRVLLDDCVRAKAGA